MSKIEVSKRRAVFAELKDYCHMCGDDDYMEVTEWSNGEGYDVCIDVQFDGEVGERSGSWKGGTVGCSYDKLPTEGIEQCLRRMEKEREFN